MRIMKETKLKRDNFLKYGNIRLNNAITSIRRLGNLSNKRAYEYDDKDIKAIINSLNSEISSLKSKFYQAKKTKKDKFDILK